MQPMAELTQPLIDDYPEAPEGHPILLQGQSSIQSGQDRPVQDAARLSNSTGHVIEISEIRFSISSDAYAISGAQLLVQLMLGNLSITKNYVPIAAFARSNQFSFSEQRATGTAIAAGGPTAKSFADYVWRLKHPIYVPPGGILEPSFRHTGFTAEDIDVKVTYLGRSLPGGYPKEFNLPYVAAWLAAPLDLSFQTDGAIATTATEETSPLEQDLANETDNTIYVESMTGRLFQVQQQVELSTAASTVVLLEDANPAINRIVFVTMRTSFGHDIVREDNPLPFRAVFGGNTRELPCYVTLPPKHFFSITITVNKGDWGVLISLPAQLAPVITIIGYRKIVIGGGK